jgi:hypothetical protein
MDELETLFRDESFVEAFGQLDWSSDSSANRSAQENLLLEFLEHGPHRRRTQRSVMGNHIGALSTRPAQHGDPEMGPVNPISMRLANGVTFETSPGPAVTLEQRAFAGSVQLMGQTHHFLVRSPILRLSDVMDHVDVAAQVTKKLRERFPFLSMDLHNAVWKFDDGREVFAEEAEAKLDK